MGLLFNFDIGGTQFVPAQAARRENEGEIECAGTSSRVLLTT